MVIFIFPDPIKKLIFLRTSKPTKQILGFYYLWTGLLDFPISSPIIFGRVCEKPQHGGGIYYFAPIKYKLEIEYKNYQDRYESIEQFLFEFIQKDPFIRELEAIRWHSHAKNEMKNIFNNIKSKLSTGNNMVDELNSNKNLLNYIKSIKHFGTQQILYKKFASEVDVSILCVPYKNTTILQIENYSSSHKNSLEAVFTLTEAFVKLL